MARPRIIWTDEMLEMLVSDYPITFNQILAEKLGISVSSLKRKARQLELVKAGSGMMNYRTWETVERLFSTHSQKQIAEKAGVSERTVIRICKALNLKRDSEEDSLMRSKGLKRVFQSDNRRILYGLEQKTDRCLGKSNDRLKVYDDLKKSGYIVIKGSRKVYFSPKMRRIVHLESYAKALGLRFEEWESE